MFEYFGSQTGYIYSTIYSFFTCLFLFDDGRPNVSKYELVVLFTKFTTFGNGRRLW